MSTGLSRFTRKLSLPNTSFLSHSAPVRVTTQDDSYMSLNYGKKATSKHQVSHSPLSRVQSTPTGKITPRLQIICFVFGELVLFYRFLSHIILHFHHTSGHATFIISDKNAAVITHDTTECRLYVYLILHPVGKVPKIRDVQCVFVFLSPKKIKTSLKNNCFWLHVTFAVIEHTKLIILYLC